MLNTTPGHRALFPRAAHPADAYAVHMQQHPGKEMWEARYSQPDYVYGTDPNDFLRSQVHHLPPGGEVLCVAEGEGRNSVFLARQGFRVTSFDLTEAGAAKTRRLAAEHGVEVDAHVADAAHFPIGEQRWDAVVSIFAHMPPPVRADLHRRVAVGLRPGGVLVLEAYTPDQIGRGTGGPPTAEMTMSLDVLRAELPGLHELHAAELVRPVVEGPGHTGDGAVVQFVARK